MEKIIACNQKMYMNFNEVSEFIKNIDEKMIIFPSDIFIPYFLGKCHVGIQEMCYNDNGPYTGKISATQTKSLGIEYVLVGHSEQRKRLTQDKIIKIVKSAQKQNLKVILCIGESKEDYKNNNTNKVIKSQLESIDNVIVAYEPVWTINTDLNPTNEEIQKAVDYIKSIIDVDVLYGGNVNVNNIENLNKIQNLSGFLLGRESTNIDHIKKIIEVC